MPTVVGWSGADNLPYEKVGKNEPVCIADEVPFEIPENWEWVRLGKIVYNRGQMKPIADFCYIDIGSIDNKNQKLNDEEFIITADKAPSRARKIVAIGDILYSTVRPYLHNMCIVNRSFSHQPIASTGFASLTCHTGFYNKFLFYYLMSPDFDAYANSTDNAKGVAYPAINDTKLYRALIPVPPEEEQKRIIKRLKKVLPYVDTYSTTYSETESLNNAFPDRMKKSILQEAVQGKLVPQDPADEPASILLERIRAEKQKLIAEGKIKKDKHESIIFRRDNSHYEKRGSEEVCIDDEISFEVPDSWELIRLNDIGDYRKGPFGSSLTKSMFVPQGIDAVKVYEQKNAIQKDHTLGSYYIKRDYYESKMSSFTVLPRDIIVSCAGTIGETYVMPNDIELGIINQALMRMRIYAPINIDYFLLYFDYVIKKEAKENSKGSAIKNIPPFEIFKKIIFPLPPLEEQKRIVEQVQQVIQWCNKL